MTSMDPIHTTATIRSFPGKGRLIPIVLCKTATAPLNNFAGRMPLAIPTVTSISTTLTARMAIIRIADARQG